MNQIVNKLNLWKVLGKIYVKIYKYHKRMNLLQKVINLFNIFNLFMIRNLKLKIWNIILIQCKYENYLVMKLYPNM